MCGAQSGFIAGKVTRDNGDIMGGATVMVDESAPRNDDRRRTGAYRFENVPPGTYDVSVRAEGYSTPRTEVRRHAARGDARSRCALDLHFAEIVSVSPPCARAVRVVSADDGSLRPGVAATNRLDARRDAQGRARRSDALATARGPARPVIRGLDGDRIAILQDGQRSGDLSSQSADHGVTVNPASATRIEVVRGPATLLYGRTRSGGLVNVLTDQIPTQPIAQPSGTFNARSPGRTRAKPPGRPRCMSATAAWR